MGRPTMRCRPVQLWFYKMSCSFTFCKCFMCFHVIDTLSDYLHSVQRYVEDFSPHKGNVWCEIGAHH